MLTAGRGHHLEDVVDEGMAMIGVVLRMRVKNQLIVRALRIGADYDHASLASAVRSEMDALIEEKQTAAQVLDAQARKARRRIGAAKHQSDYRHRDVESLKARKEIEERLIVRLVVCRADDRFTEAVLDQARDAAIHEIVRARLATHHSARDEEGYEAEREARLRTLQADLAALAKPRAE